MSLTEIKSEEEFKKCTNSDKPAMVLFSADWADQCKQVKDVLTELAKLFGDKIEFYSIQAQNFPEIGMELHIEAVPTVLIFIKGKVVNRTEGAHAAELTEQCKRLVSNGAANNTLNERLHALINQSNVMIFMKGTRDVPRCGFSKQLISIMNETGVQYETFDILTDEEVRQGLKSYSDWPTYPQVYVKGELIGGLDIIKELIESGELASVLKGA